MRANLLTFLNAMGSINQSDSVSEATESSHSNLRKLHIGNCVAPSPLVRGTHYACSEEGIRSPRCRNSLIDTYDQCFGSAWFNETDIDRCESQFDALFNTTDSCENSVELNYVMPFFYGGVSRELEDKYMKQLCTDASTRTCAEKMVQVDNCVIGLEHEDGRDISYLGKEEIDDACERWASRTSSPSSSPSAVVNNTTEESSSGSRKPYLNVFLNSLFYGAVLKAGMDLL